MLTIKLSRIKFKVIIKKDSKNFLFFLKNQKIKHKYNTYIIILLYMDLIILNNNWFLDWLKSLYLSLDFISIIISLIAVKVYQI